MGGGGGRVSGTNMKDMWTKSKRGRIKGGDGWVWR